MTAEEEPEGQDDDAEPDGATDDAEPAGENDDEEDPARQEEEPADQDPISTRIQQFTEAIGPTTLATALLIYFGYVATRARFDYFGVPLEMTGLSNQTLLLYGLEVVYVPAALIFLGVLTVVAIHATVKWRLTRDPEDATNTFLAAGIALVGVLLIGRALIGMFVQGEETSVVIGTTPLALAFGPATLAYGAWVHGKNRGRPLLPARLARNAAMCTIGLAVAGLFWASTQIAWAYGTGRGEEDARELMERPEIIIDTKEPLVELPTGITETALATAGEDRTFAYRYRGFRLLLSSGDRLFLVTPTWMLGRDQTVVVPDDGNVRIQLLPQA
ncbi:hypothetical protein [Streptomyces sp. NPDC001315]|uniref:hypothetical protein n=1 Tax=Streptomyces sp. NPDC001315 TaxID=3364562 RepID=UPI0036950BE7